MSESAVSAKRGGVSLARNRRSPKHPSEPRPSGVHPEEAEWRKKRSYQWCAANWLVREDGVLSMGKDCVAQEELDTNGLDEQPEWYRGRRQLVRLVHSWLEIVLCFLDVKFGKGKVRVINTDEASRAVCMPEFRHSDSCYMLQPQFIVRVEFQAL